MGNGQHRNRRGARPRPTPHKHGGGGNPGRATTQLIPPAAPASAAGGEISPDLGADDDIVAWEEAVPAVPATPGASGVHVTDADAEPSQEALPSAPAETRQHHHQHHHRHSADHAPQPALVEASTEETPPQSESTAEGEGASSQSSAASSGRGRFDRFYVPGQGTRGERVERVTPASSPALPAVRPLPQRADRAERVERAPAVPAVPSVSEPQNANDDDGPEYTGPRADVRGSVAALIDSLHQVFERDRSIASQGGVARCGVCYLHFPVGELTYRDVEGFYVCESCAHALGVARVPMVRRQQRQ